MAWIPVVEVLKEAITRRDWAEAEIQVDILSKIDHPRDIFQNLTLNGLPALRSIAHLKPQGINMHRRNKVVKCLTHSGYDVNQQSNYIPGMLSSRKYTDLLAAIDARNYNLVRSLLRYGARTDIRDGYGFSPLHEAIAGKCRNIVDLLLDFGASVTSSEGERNGEVAAHPLLHTAVDGGDAGMVAHLLRKRIFDVNEKAVYGRKPWTTTQTFTPLGRALCRSDSAIFWNLMDQPGIRAELEDIQYCLVKGNADWATCLVGKLSDLRWGTIGGGQDGAEERVPSLLWLLHNITAGLSLPERYRARVPFLPALAGVVREFVENGYDLRETWSATRESPPVVREPLLIYALRIDMIGGTNLLLQTLLQLDHLQGLVPVTCREGRNCLERLLRTWSDCCLADEGTECWRNGVMGERMTCCVEAVKLLMSHGLNVSGVVIRKEFRYHFGYKPIIQLLYRNGARIDNEYFTAGTVCRTGGGPVSREMKRELRDLKVWKEEFDHENPISLMNLCWLQIRKMLTGGEDLKMLQGLPAELNDFVMRNNLQ